MKIRAKKNFYLNPIAQLYLLADAIVRVLIAGRGFGKSFVNGIRILVRVLLLPRSTGMFLGKTYTQILSNTIMPMMNAWEWYGYRRDVHYVIGKKPPKHFKHPYQRPERYENIISWWNGTIVRLGSFDRPQLMRGGSNDWVMNDEALLTDKEVYDEVIVPSIRPSDLRLSGKPGMLAQDFTSSMPFGSMGMWLLDIEPLATESPDKFFFIEGTSWHNRQVLGDDTLEGWKDTMSPITYQIECLNKRVRNVGDQFYPKLSKDVHYYNAYDYTKIDGFNYDQRIHTVTSDWYKDIDPAKPFDLGFDFGAFNCMVVGQEHRPYFNIVNSFWVKHPQIETDLVKKFCEHYKDHKNKLVRVWGDKAGNRRDGRVSLNTFQTLQKTFRELGWRTQLCKVGDITHAERHDFFKKLMSEEQSNLPKLRINEDTNKDFIISMETAGMYNEGKDKRAERQDVAQEHTTHFTDAFDYLMYHKFLKGWSSRRVPTNAGVMG
jgi:hypothetical protein